MHGQQNTFPSHWQVELQPALRHGKNKGSPISCKLSYPACSEGQESAQVWVVLWLISPNGLAPGRCQKILPCCRSWCSSLQAMKGAHLHAESLCEGHSYILNVHTFKDNYMNVLFCSLPVLFEPSPLPSSAFKCFLRINVSRSIFNNRSWTFKQQSSVKCMQREGEGKAILHPSSLL